MATERPVTGPKSGVEMEDHVMLQKHRGHVARIKSCLGLVSDHSRKDIMRWCIEMESQDLTEGVPWDTLHTIVTENSIDEMILMQESLAFREYVDKVRSERVVDLGPESVPPQSTIAGISAATQAAVTGRKSSGLHGLYAAARHSSAAPKAKAAGEDKK